MSADMPWPEPDAEWVWPVNTTLAQVFRELYVLPDEVHIDYIDDRLFAWRTDDYDDSGWS